MKKIFLVKIYQEYESENLKEKIKEDIEYGFIYVEVIEVEQKEEYIIKKSKEEEHKLRDWGECNVCWKDLKRNNCINVASS